MSQRVLIVEDEDATRRALVAYFGRLGYAVGEARDREKAESELASRRFDVVITDLRLTAGAERGGLDVATAARGHATRVVLLTAYSSPAVRCAARACGVDVVLDKPQPLAQLATVVARLLRDPVPRHPDRRTE